MKARFHLPVHVTSIPCVCSWPSSVSITLHGIRSPGANKYVFMSVQIKFKFCYFSHLPKDDP